jgi:hypothetical protein
MKKKAAFWDKPNPKKKSTKLTAKQIAAAKARAKAAGTALSQSSRQRSSISNYRRSEVDIGGTRTIWHNVISMRLNQTWLMVAPIEHQQKWLMKALGCSSMGSSSEQ